MNLLHSCILIFIFYLGRIAAPFLYLYDLLCFTEYFPSRVYFLVCHLLLFFTHFMPSSFHSISLPATLRMVCCVVGEGREGRRIGSELKYRKKNCIHRHVQAVSHCNALFNLQLGCRPAFYHIARQRQRRRLYLRST